MFRKLFALSDQGAKDLKKGIVSSFIVNLSLMLPVNIFIMLLGKMLIPVFTEESTDINLWSYTLAAVIVFIIIYICHYVQYNYTYNAAYKESANRRITLAEKIRKLPLSFFGQRDLSDLTTIIMGDCTDLEHTFAHAIPQFFGSILSITLVCIFLFLFEWRMALAVLSVLPVAAILVIGTKKLQNKYGTKKVEVKLTASDGIQEFLENIKDLKASGKDEEYLEKLDKKLDDVIKESVRSEMVTGSLVSSAQATLKLGFAVVVLVGANLLRIGEISFLTYLIFLITASRIYDPLATVFMQIAEIFNAGIQIKRMKTIEKEEIQTGKEECKVNNFDISFDKVSFAYNDKQVLKDVSFTAKQGEITALVGPSGSGKSTVSKLATRFWDINKGKITLGGIDIGTVDPETLLKNYAIVFQDVVLFNGSIMDNIRVGKRDATDEEVLAVAKAANCDSFITRFENGYDTVIGENGSTLSGGERQRISIARALLKNAPVILLDEATASLDVENETQIQEALSILIKDKTVIVIAHRMRTVLGVDKIVVLEEGRVVESDKPDKLLMENGLFSKLVKLQQQSSHWEIG